MKNTSNNTPTALQRLIQEPKGKIDYAPHEAFLLHVFWQAPSEAAAAELLAALQRCATATHRDTPCVPTYFFRRVEQDDEIGVAVPTYFFRRVEQDDEIGVGAPPATVGEHPQLTEAHKKLRVGIPRPAVVADLTRRGIDPALLNLDPSAPLPAELQAARPVAVEFTELYLDERAFMEHAGSRDYLEAYGQVISPAMQGRAPVTVRLGTPVASVVDKILEPMLKAPVPCALASCALASCALASCALATVCTRASLLQPHASHPPLPPTRLALSRADCFCLHISEPAPASPAPLITSLAPPALQERVAPLHPPCFMWR
eukprot:CAMPEP_0113719592 /NCGR_PEP_ID=MMETSP0038_2-20120614/35920_1 /TAXON_ID=2898 /ORGANISM="Cryptomonas paramecium" /LENGTH=316 /DNA_ID=CAMNT_0000648021 /DNA_START=89 /DNA_END=1036 /DNA_ORIENTATION=+ /assembly_acc=CAM_ASM_000170